MKLNIIRGSDREFTVRITVKDSSEPFNLGNAVQIKALFPREDSDAPIEVNLTGGQVSVLSAIAGKIRISLNESQTAMLNPGEDQSFEVEIQIGLITSIVQFKEQLNVIDRVFGGG